MPRLTRRCLAAVLAIATLLPACSSSPPTAAKPPATPAASTKAAAPAKPAAPVTAAAPAKLSPSRWAKEMDRLAALDAATGIKHGGVVFTGSSSIRLWDTDKWFPGMGVVNRGFGGSQISDVNEWIERTVLVHKPRLVVMYCGGNDLNAGKTPQHVAGDFQRFVSLVHAGLPKTRIAYISNNPSRRRWAQREAQQETNALIQRIVAGDKRLAYIDTYGALLDERGEPRDVLFRADQLHLSEDGYAVMTRIVKPLVERELGASAAR